ncbi:MAG TPA: tetratricopeptide repeat protein [Vicinamibacterales bacterium]|nr:tetratricopeptide repeat protein [Vicinamibacterales bacterium]
MPIDRAETLKKAEKALRQGRLDIAIAEYLHVVEDQPRDWNMANTLGDLYVRAGQPDKAAGQYVRIAEHFAKEGFYPKAAALYKKILKVRPDDETALLQLAEVSARLGLLADAKSQLGTVIKQRQTRGDMKGANELVVRLGALDPGDFDARLTAARVMAEMGKGVDAAARFRQIADELRERGREEEATNALREAVRLNPEDVEGRSLLARDRLARNDVDGAREFLDADSAGRDPELMVALAEVELRGERDDNARDILKRLLEKDKSKSDAIANLGWTFVNERPMTAFMCIEMVVDSRAAERDYASAAAMLQEYVARASTQVPALLKLVELCVDGGLESTMYDAQAQLCDAYLAGGQSAEARVIAEDLVAREPWERGHIERFRQALVMQKVSDPDSIIAERLSGQSPFLATDHFAPLDLNEPPAEQPSASSSQATDATSQTAARRGAGSRNTAPSSEETEVDLTGVFASTPAPSLTDVFKSKTGPDSDDPGEQLKLARTYLDTGMPEEAIGALEAASRSPRHRFDAASALARLYAQRGDFGKAVEWFERAAEAPAPTTDAGRALLYDLGVALEAAGEIARALAVFVELQADADRYRDVHARIGRLSRVQTGG